jgi:hypothetical protein
MFAPALRTFARRYRNIGLLVRKVEDKEVWTMTSTNMHRIRYLLAAFFSSVLLGTSIYMFPQELEYSAHPLNTTRPPRRNIHDDSLLVRGIYWELPLAGVHALILDSNKLKVRGDSISSSGAVSLAEITRTIPSELTATNLKKDSSRVWSQSDLITCYGNNSTHCYRTFERFSTRESFCYEEPFRSSYQISHVYLGQKDTTAIVFAFGKMNQDTTKWMGYILITKRHPK